MRAAKNIFLILGILCILFNIMAYLGGHNPFKEKATDVGFNPGYFIGSNILIIIGVIFLNASNRYNKKIKKKREADLLDGFLSDTKENLHNK